MALNHDPPARTIDGEPSRVRLIPHLLRNGGGLKNAIDRASRPYGKNAFARKPSAVIGTSPGKIGTAVGQQHLRSILSFCNSPQMNAPEACIQFTPGLITGEGEVTDDTTTGFLRNYMAELHGFITRVYTVLPRGA